MSGKAAMTFAAIIAALALQATNVQAQSWAAWQGCWRGTAADAAHTVCVLPGETAQSARLVTLTDGIVADETMLHADNVARNVSEGGCTGSETAFFSQDGRRIFTRAELDCNGTKRVSTGVIAMITEAEWVDAQVVTINDQHSARSVRYRMVSLADVPPFIANELPVNQRLAQESARLNATAPLDMAAIVEASRVLAPPAVEALLAARQHGYDLDARRLVLLKEQGVAASTIDVIVALSYPSRFAVRERPAESFARGDDAERTPRADLAYRDCYDPYRYRIGRRYNTYDRCYDDYRYSSRYNRYGYSPWGYDPYGWRYGDPIIVIVSPDDEERQQGGSVVKGRGFTRGTTPATGSAEPRSTTRTSSGAGAAPAATTSSPPPSSTGSSATSTGRTAKPRGGGGS